MPDDARQGVARVVKVRQLSCHVDNLYPAAQVVKVDSCQGGSSSDGSTEQVSTLPVEANTVAVEQVLVDPESSAHVVVHHQVDDGTTRHVGVIVSDTVVELDHHLTGDEVSMEPVGSSGRASNEFGEHVERSEEWRSVSLS